ncbi:hypothetical protein [Nocardioides mesophilus]|uniref:hypothetical protein n=1 Tax=Nocardioides mesophilus TaxID=433659 RepID=UPI001FEBA9F4|nr:hypothetical protein [Nocardioides mesophilus]
MSRSFLVRQLLGSALTGNALRPPQHYLAQIPAMFAGWLSGELAPHLLTLTVADTALQLRRRDRSRLGLVLAAANTVGLATLVAESLGRGTGSTRPWWKASAPTTSSGSGRPTPTSTCPRR